MPRSHLENTVSHHGQPYFKQKLATKQKPLIAKEQGIDGGPPNFERWKQDCISKMQNADAYVASLIAC
jgi:hypothetical protein